MLNTIAQSHPKRFAATLATLIFIASLASAQAVAPEFKEYPDAAAVGNFATDDLLQGLTPDTQGGYYSAGSYCAGAFAGDAVDAANPGSTGPEMGTCAWYKMPAYLIYTLPKACDISEIRMTAVRAEGADEDRAEPAVALGNLALGITRQTNPGGQPPIRPTESAIEVMFEGQELWTPVAAGPVASPKRALPQGLWQGVWRFPAGTLRHVRQIKFTLGATAMWASNNYGQITRLSEIDVLGQASTGEAPRTLALVPHTDSSIAYAGFVHPEGTSGQSALVKWSGSGFTCRFRSSLCRLRFAAPSGSQYWVKVDGSPFTECALTPVMDLTPKLAADHDVHELQLVKKTEPDTGVDSFLGIELSPDGKLLPVTRPERTILFLGDSITVGMGAGLKQETDALRSYAWLTGQHFKAEPRLVALSGVGLFEGWRTPLFGVEWQQVAAQVSDAATEPLSWQPDLIVVNLSTNDKSKGVAGTDVAASMKALLVDVRQRCPKATILVMVPWSYGCYREELRAVVDGLATAGDALIHFVAAEPGTWVPEGGMRDNTHPNTKGHQHAAKMLIPAIESAMKW
jgi:lysophospholipase L1-like esterase